MKRKIIKMLFFYTFVISLFLLGTFLGNRTVTVLSETIPVIRHHTIVIDAGHGGEDGGAVSCSGKNESTYNLEIALRLEDLFHLLGRDTRMVRRTDTAVYTGGETIVQKKISDLKERVRISNQSKNNILVSIHQNQFSDSRYHGAEVFYSCSAGSKALAQLLQAEIIASINPGSHRECKAGDGIYILDKLTVPGILVECGYLSNQNEEANLRKGEYQKKICSVIAATISRFLEEA